MTESNNAKTTVVPRESVLDPRKPGLCQPFKRMVEEGMAEISVVFTAVGFQATGKPGKILIDIQDSNLVAEQNYPVVHLLNIAEGAGLLQRGKKGKSGKAGEQPLPSKSLCKRDFVGTTNSQLFNRASAVASAANGGTLTGRAREAGAFTGTVTTTFQDWWVAASARQRATSLCQKKSLAELDEADINRLGGGMPCPFRGTTSFLVSSKDDNEVEEVKPPKTPESTGKKEEKQSPKGNPKGTGSQGKPSPK